MSHIPDCRTDENYNQKYLNRIDSEFVAGYDYAVEQILNLLNNMDVCPALEELLDDNKAIIMKGKTNIVHDAISDWAEMQRDELITSMIDNMSEEEYAEIKEKVDGQSQT